MATSPEGGWYPNGGGSTGDGEQGPLYYEQAQGKEGMGGMREEQGLRGTWSQGAGAEEGESSGGRYSNDYSNSNSNSASAEGGSFTPRGSRRSHVPDGGSAGAAGRRGGWKKDHEGGARRKDKGALGNAAGEGAAAVAAAVGGGEGGAGDEAGDVFASDEFRMYQFKVKKCMRSRSHDWTECPYAHPGEKARRRDPRKFAYTGAACPDFRKGSCRRGDACPYAHGVFECWLHPNRYRTEPCKDGTGCTRRVCFFAHTPSQLRTPPPSPASPGASLSPSPPSTPQGQPGFVPDSAPHQSTGHDARLAPPSPVQSPSQSRQGLRQGLAHSHPEAEGACAACSTCNQRGWEPGRSAAHQVHAVDTGLDAGDSGRMGLSSSSEPQGDVSAKLLPTLIYHHRHQQQQQQQQQYGETEGEGAAQHRERAAGVHMQRVLEGSAAQQGSFLQGKLGRPGGARLQLQIAEAAGEAFGASSSGGGERDTESDTFLGTPLSTWTPPSSSRSSNGFNTPGAAAHQGLVGWTHHGGLGGPYAGGAGGMPLGHVGLQAYVGSPASDLGAIGQGAIDSPSSAKSSPALLRSVSVSPSLGAGGTVPGMASLSPPLHYVPGAPTAAFSSFYASVASSQGQGLGEDGGRGSQGQGTRLGQQAMMSGSYGGTSGGTHRPPLSLPSLSAPLASGTTHHDLNALCNGLALAQDAAGTPTGGRAPSPGSPLLAHSPLALHQAQAAFGVPMAGLHEGQTAHPGVAFFPHHQHHHVQQQQHHQQQQHQHQQQEPEASVAHGEFAVRSAPLTSVEGSWLRLCQENDTGVPQPLEAQLQRLSMESWPAQEAFRASAFHHQQQQQCHNKQALEESRAFREWRLSQSQPQRQQQQSQSQVQGDAWVQGSDEVSYAGTTEPHGHHKLPRLSGTRPPLLNSSSMPVHRVATSPPVGNQLPVQGPFAPPNPGTWGGGGSGEGGDEGGGLFPRAVSDCSHNMGLVSRVGGAVPRSPPRTQGLGHSGGASSQAKGATEWKQHAGGVSPYGSSPNRVGFGAIIEGEEAQGDGNPSALGGAGTGGFVAQQQQHHQPPSQHGLPGVSGLAGLLHRLPSQAQPGAGGAPNAGLEAGFVGNPHGVPGSGAAPDLDWVTDLVLEEHHGSGYGSGVPGGPSGSGAEAGGGAEAAAGAGVVACHAHSSSSVWSSPRGGVYSPLF